MALNFCPRCGTPVDADERFCSNCGCTIRPAPAPQPTTQAKRNDSKARAARPAKKKSSARIVWGLVAVVVLAVGAAAVFATMEKTITLSDNSLTLYSGDTKALSATVGKGSTANVPLKWSSSNTDVATVAGDGTVTAVGAGNAVIYVSAQGYAAKKCVLKVNQRDVYVAGSEENGEGTAIATLWRNGEAQRLTDEKTHVAVHALFVSGKDVYVVGDVVNAQDNWVATLWKNGAPQSLSNGKDEAAAYSVFVADGDVHVAGFEKSAQGIHVPTHWKNGIRQGLEFAVFSRGALATSVFVAGNDTYVAGYGADQSGQQHAVLWKNGKPLSTLFDGRGAARWSSAFVSGDDVYLGGHVSDTDRMFAILQKNEDDSLSQNLSHEKFSSVQSVYVSGGDIFAAGYEVNARGESSAVLWKNGKAQRLNSGKQQAEAKSVFVTGKDVYVAGRTEDDEGMEVAVLWKNGQKTVLGKGSANSVFVQ